MKVVFTKQFNRDIRRIKDRRIASLVEAAIGRVKLSAKLSEINNLKKLTGYHNAYRIRIGDYRLGIFVDNDEVMFTRFLHRREIYRYFP
jgi:mRNA interferase RelE/StbE